MLAPYAKIGSAVDSNYIKSLLLNKVNFADSNTVFVTPAQLAARTATIGTFSINSTISSQINSKLNISDTAAMLKPYATHADLLAGLANVALTPGPQGVQGVPGQGKSAGELLLPPFR